VFTLRGIRPLVDRRKVEEAESGDTSIHPTAVAAGQAHNSCAEQLRVNGRREHGNVIRNLVRYLLGAESVEKIEFKIPEVFFNDDISVWVTGALMILNDTTKSSLKLAYSTSDSDIFYYLRLTASHYKESLRYIVLSREKNKVIDDYISSSNDLLELYAEATAYDEKFYKLSRRLEIIYFIIQKYGIRKS